MRSGVESGGPTTQPVQRRHIAAKLGATEWPVPPDRRKISELAALSYAIQRAANRSIPFATFREKRLGAFRARDCATHRDFIGAPHGLRAKLHRSPANETIFGHFPGALDEDVRC